jgi:hypothetical protein
MQLFDMPDTPMTQEEKVSPETSQPQVDHPNDGTCQFEMYQEKTCGETCAFTGWHFECRCKSHLYGQLYRNTNQRSSQTPEERSHHPTNRRGGRTTENHEDS